MKHAEAIKGFEAAAAQADREACEAESIARSAAAKAESARRRASRAAMIAQVQQALALMGDEVGERIEYILAKIDVPEDHAKELAHEIVEASLVAVREIIA